MLRKLKWQIPGEPLAARYNWYQGPVPGRGPAVEKHWCTALGVVTVVLRSRCVVLCTVYKFVHKTTVMPMEIFVSCVGDLSTVGGPVVVVTRSVLPLATSIFLSARPWGLESFHPGSFLALWPSWVFEGWWCEHEAREEPSLPGHILGLSVSLLPVYRLQITVLSLRFTVCFNLTPGLATSPWIVLK